MKKLIQTGIVIIAILFCVSVSANPVREVNWADLIPEHLRSDDLLANLSTEQRDMLLWVINTMDNLPKRGPETEEYYEEVDKAIPSLKEAGIDLPAIMAKRKQLRTAVNEDLNGKLIRMPGYLLPLETKGERVTEFLLVPYVGACIHVPPPPPNQIVHVNVNQKGGYKSNKLFDPVWITGELSIQSLSKELYLVDGTAGIDIGYSMNAQRIEPYKAP